MTYFRTATSPANALILLGSVFVVAACGLVYELVAGAVSSYILGDAVTQFSLVIGVFLCAMGVGSYLAQFINRRLMTVFIEIEIWIGLVGGGSSIIMFAVSAFAEAIFAVFFYALCALIGILIGLEIPLLVRLLKQNHGLSEALSNVLAIDYIGALAGSILFPLLVLPYLGLSKASVVFGIMNLLVAAAGLRLLPERRQWMALKIVAAGIVLLTGLLYSARMIGFLEDLIYQDNIIYAKTSAYQRIVLTRWRNDIRLYLNGHIQFSSIDEARYHEALVIPAMEANPYARKILILGGGDGMAAREVLKYKRVESIVLVDIDPAITELAQRRPELVTLNKGALNSAKLKIFNMDAFKFLAESNDFFDVIIIDLPDPSSEVLAKLYSRSFYSMCARRLALDGIFVTQATSPFYATDAFWCIAHTIGQAGPQDPGIAGLWPHPYHAHVPSFGEWGFVLAGKRPVHPRQLSPSVPTRFLNAQTLPAMFSFAKDIQPSRPVDINRLERPILNEYYKKGWKKYNQ